MKKAMALCILMQIWVLILVGCKMPNSEPSFKDITINEIQFEEFSDKNVFYVFVEMQCRPSGGSWKPTFYYTLDGSEPTEQSEKATLGGAYAELDRNSYRFTLKVLAVFTDGNSKKTKTGEKIYDLSIRRVTGDHKQNTSSEPMSLVKGKGYYGLEFLNNSLYGQYLTYYFIVEQDGTIEYKDDIDYGTLTMRIWRKSNSTGLEVKKGDTVEITGVINKMIISGKPASAYEFFLYLK